MEKITYTLESFKNIQDLIKFADQKAGAILIIVGLIFNSIVKCFENQTIAIDNLSCLSFATFIFGLISIVILFIILYFTIFEILRPRFATNYESDSCSTFYFEHIAVNTEKLKEKYSDIKEDDMLKDILDQKIEIAKILTKKNKNLKKSFSWLFVLVVTSIIFILLSNLL
ncbi:hypothetical protein [Myroides odoratimimus]|uniref:hypothetical protein n=1 Tax=Myroides odoratimimus TaxID=76832 RepID=UPI00310154AC